MTPSSYQADVASFVETLKVCSAGTITVVDMAWCNPGGRGWCLYEWNHTYALHGIEALKFVGMSEDDRQRIIDEIDVEKARCAKAEDQTMILGEILQKHGSYKAFNHRLKLLLELKPLSYRVDLHELWKRCETTVWNFEPVQNWLAARLPLTAEARAAEGGVAAATKPTSRPATAGTSRQLALAATKPPTVTLAISERPATGGPLQPNAPATKKPTVATSASARAAAVLGSRQPYPHATKVAGTLLLA
jgi:hypothetical protein